MKLRAKGGGDQVIDVEIRSDQDLKTISVYLVDDADQEIPLVFVDTFYGPDGYPATAYVHMGAAQPQATFRIDGARVRGA